jgi:hypothetical protein
VAWPERSGQASDAAQAVADNVQNGVNDAEDWWNRHHH